MQRGDSARVRLDLLDAGGVQPAQAGDPVGPATTLELLQARELRGVGRDDQLAASLARDPPPLAVLIQLARSGDAQARLQRPRLVVDAGVDHAGVVAGLMAAELGLALEHAERGARGATQPLARDGPA